MDTYEQKYNEAMLRADEAVQKGCLDKNIFDIIFPPEESEDERIRKAIIYNLSNLNIIYNATKEECLSWLEKQKEQKPVEWSEEDEKMRKSLIASLARIGANTRTDSTSTNYTFPREIAWLKSLRPQYHGDVTMTEAYKMGLEVGKASSWKPSEEQMNALNFAITYFMHETNYKNPTELRDLYDDLLKLK